MSKEQEMVTISYEVTADHAKQMASGAYTPQYDHPRREACRKALEARKTPLERWREGRGDWATRLSADTGRWYIDSPASKLGFTAKGILDGDDAQLMAAAPDLFEVCTRLMALIRPVPGPDIAKHHSDYDQYAYRDAKRAIRKAAPDIANSILGDK